MNATTQAISNNEAVASPLHCRCCQARVPSLKDRIGAAIDKVVFRRTQEQLEERRVDRAFRRWSMAIVGDVGNQTFKIGEWSYRTEVVNWANGVKVVLMKGDTKWSDIENKGRHHPWFVQLVKIEKRGDEYWSIDVRDVGNFHHYQDLPDGKRDCYCRPENREQRVPELRQAVEDALIRWIES